MGRALRADAERSIRAILEAAERVLADDPSASMEQIAEAAGVTRITVHRRFANRQALIEALAVSATQQIIDAIEEARPDAAPALVAMYRVTASVLKVKSTWQFTLRHAKAHTDIAAALWADINARTNQLLTRAQQEGVIDPAADLEWVRRVYYALLSEVLQWSGAGREAGSMDPDSLASIVIDTLLHGVGTRE
jgi:AcrR family transcriptional regulator